jgi:predicted DNA-binding protein (MmcQ/YjbR family)
MAHILGGCARSGGRFILVAVRDPISQLRAICLRLPEAYEEETWGEATFRVRKKIFALAADHDGAGTVCMKAPREEQLALLAQGEPYFFPRYVGSKGWIGIDLCSNIVDWTEVTELVRESYRLVAPKKVSARLDEPAGAMTSAPRARRTADGSSPGARRQTSWQE